MGNHKFKLSNMLLPNSWFYKFRYITTKSISPLSKKNKQPPYPPPSSPPPSPPPPPPSPPLPICKCKHPRKSYHFTRKFPPDPPRKSSKQSKNRSTNLNFQIQEFRSDRVLVTAKKLSRDNESITELDLPPIITKNIQLKKNPKRAINSPGVKLRVNSPKMKILMTSRRRRAEAVTDDSFAVVKSSVDPERDFRESMAEMILKKNISDSKDLEDLLACYLCLNSDEYHYLIIKVFKKIWFDFY